MFACIQHAQPHSLTQTHKVTSPLSWYWGQKSFWPRKKIYQNCIALINKIPALPSWLDRGQLRNNWSVWLSRCVGVGEPTEFSSTNKTSKFFGNTAQRASREYHYLWISVETLTIKTLTMNKNFQLSASEILNCTFISLY